MCRAGMFEDKNALFVECSGGGGGSGGGAWRIAVISAVCRDAQCVLDSTSTLAGSIRESETRREIPRSHYNILMKLVHPPPRLLCVAPLQHVNYKFIRLGF